MDNSPTVKKAVEITLSGRDVTGPAVAAAKRSLDELQAKAKATEQASMRASARLVGRSAEEQAARDMVAGRMRAMRDAAGKARIREMADSMMYGSQAATAAPTRPGLTAADFNRGVVSRGDYASRESNAITAAGAMKAFVAIAAAREFTQAMQRMPDAIETYHKRLREGASGLEAFHAASMQASGAYATAANTVGGFVAMLKAIAPGYREALAEQSAARAKAAEEEAAKTRLSPARRAAIEGAEAAAGEARDAAYLMGAGRDPEELARRRAELARRKEAAEIARRRREAEDLAKQLGGLSKEEASRVQANLGAADAGSRMEYVRGLDEANAVGNARRSEELRQRAAELEAGRRQREEQARAAEQARRERARAEEEAFAEQVRQAEQQAQAMTDRIRENVMSSRIESAPLERGENRLLVGARSMGDGERDWQREVANGLAAALRELRSSNANLQRVERAVGQSGLQVSQMTGP